MHFLNRSKKEAHRRAHYSVLPNRALALAASFIVAAGSACYHPTLVASYVPPAPGDTSGAAPRGNTSGAGSKTVQRCAAYILLVENALPRAVEIYEVGHMSDRFVGYAQIGITEVPMTESSQQFVAMSRGEIMAESSNNTQRPGDRVALQRGCRPY